MLVLFMYETWSNIQIWNRQWIHIKYSLLFILPSFSFSNYAIGSDETNHIRLLWSYCSSAIRARSWLHLLQTQTTIQTIPLLHLSTRPAQNYWLEMHRIGIHIFENHIDNRTLWMILQEIYLGILRNMSM